MSDLGTTLIYICTISYNTFIFITELCIIIMISSNIGLVQILCINACIFLVTSYIIILFCYYNTIHCHFFSDKILELCPKCWAIQDKDYTDVTMDFNFKYIPLWIAGTCMYHSLVGWKIEGFILCDYEIMSY